MKRYRLEELESRPTLSVGQADDLKVDNGHCRVWLSRVGIEDGQPYDNMVTVEEIRDGQWIETDRYQAR